MQQLHFGDQYGFWRKRLTQKPGMTSEEYSILLQLKLGNSKISNQSGKVAQACFYTVAIPQRQPENANSNFKP